MPTTGLYQPYSAPFETGDWRTIKSELLTDRGGSSTGSDRADTVAISPGRPHIRQLRRSQVDWHPHPTRWDRGLRGVFMWELTGDDEEHSLLQAMVWPFE